MKIGSKNWRDQFMSRKDFALAVGASEEMVDVLTGSVVHRMGDWYHAAEVPLARRHLDAMRQDIAGRQ